MVHLDRLPSPPAPDASSAATWAEEVKRSSTRKPINSFASRKCHFYSRHRQANPAVGMKLSSTQSRSHPHRPAAHILVALHIVGPPPLAGPRRVALPLEVVVRVPPRVRQLVPPDLRSEHGRGKAGRCWVVEVLRGLISCGPWAGHCMLLSDPVATHQLALCLRRDLLWQLGDSFGDFLGDGAGRGSETWQEASANQQGAQRSPPGHAQAVHTSLNLHGCNKQKQPLLPGSAHWEERGRALNGLRGNHFALVVTCHRDGSATAASAPAAPAAPPSSSGHAGQHN